MSQEEVLTCSHCHGEMLPLRLRVGRIRVLFAGLLMAWGILLLVQSLSQPILVIPSVLILALAWWIGLRRAGVWYCTRCSHTAPRGAPIDLGQRRKAAEPVA